jgi:2-hydroxy-3-keto-5-methylthiopentenyl-1-phosphate phosphatase
MPLLAQETKLIVFSDFDGTITLNDSNGIFSGSRLGFLTCLDFMTDNLGFGVEKRRAMNEAVITGSRTFRLNNSMNIVLKVGIPFPKCWEVCTRLLNNVKRSSLKVCPWESAIIDVDIHLDPGFTAFYDWTLNHNVPVIILSSGMEPLIRALLAKLIGPKAEAIPVICNSVQINPDGSWHIVFHDESGTLSSARRLTDRLWTRQI